MSHLAEGRVYEWVLRGNERRSWIIIKIQIRYCVIDITYYNADQLSFTFYLVSCTFHLISNIFHTSLFTHVSHLVLYRHLQHPNDTIVKTDPGRLLYKIYFSLYCKVRKGCVGFHCEREQETEQKLQYFDPSLLWPSRCVFLVLLMLNRRSRGPLCWVMVSFTASYQQLFWTPTIQGFSRAPSAGCSFPCHLSSITVSSSTATGTRTQLSWLLSWLSYIIVQRPLDLWNRMFNRHQAEITVMQFRGHSLPVRQSMRVSWDFLACPILSANFRPRDFLS